MENGEAAADEERSSRKEPTYAGDQPIESKVADEFHRWPFAKRVADTLASREDPSSLVVGIYGPWGSGKTSTLYLMEEALREHTEIVQLRFNPWYFETVEQLLRGFFDTLADAVGKTARTGTERLGDLLRQYGSLLSVASVNIAGIARLDAGAAAQGLGQALSTATLGELKTRIESILAKSGKRIVIFIDDIDRLDRREIRALFKLAKLSAGFRYTSYVLAFDEELVAGALAEEYGGGDVDAGQRFIEKIVQVPLHLPPPDQLALRKFTLQGVDTALCTSGIELSEEQVEVFVRRFVDGLEPALRTPRQARLYGNILLFALPILKGEVDTVDQMLVEGIRIFYPKLYFTIRDNPGYFLRGVDRNAGQADALRDRARRTIERGLAESGVLDKDVVRRRLLEALFPRLESVFGNTGYTSDWDDRWAKEQRVCSEHYFARYFSYSVPTGDVSDLEIERFLDVARTGAGDLQKALEPLAAGDSARQLIAKLRRREEQLRGESARTLAVAIARSGQLLPREKAMLLSDWTFMQAAILVAHLTKQASSDSTKRAEIAQEVIREGEPLPFAFECYRWLRRGEKEQDDPILEKAQEEELAGILAGRIHDAANARPPYAQYPNDAPALLWLWQQERPLEVSEYLKKRLAAHPEEIDDLLSTYVGTAWAVGSGLSSKADFQRSGYDAVTKLVQPDRILQLLRDGYGAELDEPVYHHGSDVPLTKRIAHQFAYIYRDVEKGEEAHDQRGEGRQ